MKIYIATWGTGGDAEIVGLFSSWQAAYQKANDGQQDSCVHVWDLDGDLVLDYVLISSMEPTTAEEYELTAKRWKRCVNSEFCEERDPTQVQP
jgi:hypothetical protein